MNPFSNSYEGVVAVFLSFIVITVTYKSLKNNEGLRLIYIFLIFIILIFFLIRESLL